MLNCGVLGEGRKIKRRERLALAGCAHSVCVHPSRPDTLTHSQRGFGMWLVGTDEADLQL